MVQGQIEKNIKKQQSIDHDNSLENEDIWIDEMDENGIIKNFPISPAELFFRKPDFEQKRNQVVFGKNQNQSQQNKVERSKNQNSEKDFQQQGQNFVNKKQSQEKKKSQIFQKNQRKITKSKTVNYNNIIQNQDEKQKIKKDFFFIADSLELNEQKQKNSSIEQKQNTEKESDNNFQKQIQQLERNQNNDQYQFSDSISKSSQSHSNSQKSDQNESIQEKDDKKKFERKQTINIGEQKKLKKTNKGQPFEIFFRLNQFLRFFLYFVVFQHILGPFSLILFKFFDKNFLILARNLDYVGFNFKVFWNYSQFIIWVACASILSQNNFIQQLKLDEFLSIFYLSLGILIVKALQFAYMHPSKVKLYETQILSEKQKLDDRILGNWSTQEPEFVYQEILNCMSRLEVENSSFYIAFMVDFDQDKLQKLINFERPSQSVDDEKSQKSENQKEQVKKKELSLDKDMPYVYIMYYYCKLYILDLERKLFLLNQLTQIVAPKKRENDEINRKLYPTINLVCPVSLKTWSQLRRIILEYGKKQMTCLLIFMAGYIAIMLIKGFIIILQFTMNYYSQSNYQNNNDLSMIFDLIFLGYFSVRSIILGSKINMSTSEQKTQLIENKFIFNDIKTNISIYIKNTTKKNWPFSSPLYSTLFSYFEQTGKKHNLGIQDILIHLQSLMEAIETHERELEITENLKPYKVLGIAMSKDFATRIGVSIISLFTSLMVDYLRTNFSKNQ